MEELRRDCVARLAAVLKSIRMQQLRRMTVEESLRAFEELNRRETVVVEEGPRSHPVGLIKYWKAF